MSDVLTTIFAFAWDFLLIALAFSIALLLLTLFGGSRRNAERRVDELLTRGDSPALRAELRANARLYPTRRDVMGVHKEAPAPLDTARRATHRRGDLDAHHTR